MKTDSHQPLRTRTFVYCTDAKRNLTGWKPVGTDDSFYPGPGHLVYHDTVEHFGNSESWDRELLAFGATMYGRMHYDPDMMVVNVEDFVGFFTRDQKFIVPPCHGIFCKKTLPSEKNAEEFLQAYMHGIRKELEMRMDFLSTLFTGQPAIELPYSHAELEKNLKNAEDWFRRGWWLARRLHHKQSFNQIIGMMRKLTNDVNSMTEHMHPNIGDKITVSVNRANSTYTIATA